MEPKEFNWSKKESEKSKRFIAELRKIEEKHSDYFRNRKTSSEFMPHDMLAEHYIFQESKNGEVNFFFPEYSDLDDEIKKECLVAFEQVYNQ